MSRADGRGDGTGVATARGDGRAEIARVEEHDVVGVGLGPFNLGLAALLEPVADVDAVFLEARAAFSWHPGLLLEGTTLQVPFLADLVTLTDPTSPYSFLNYLHRHGRLYRFYFYERFHVPRQEYDHYCRWVAEHLPSCRFGQRVVEIRPLPDGRWSILAQTAPTPAAAHSPDGSSPDDPSGDGATGAGTGADDSSPPGASPGHTPQGTPSRGGDDFGRGRRSDAATLDTSAGRGIGGVWSGAGIAHPEEAPVGAGEGQADGDGLGESRFDEVGAGGGPPGTTSPTGPSAGAATLVEYRARAVVLGVGSSAYVPACARGRVGETVFHSGEYLAHRDGDEVRRAASVTVIGSGQSAAEVFADLLSQRPGRAEETGRPARLDWFTRSRGFLPMEYSKLGLEHFTPEYTAYFHGLDEERRDELRSGQDLLYKGISSETSEQIYDTLYEASIGGREPDVGYRSACELRAIDPIPGTGPAWRLSFHHLDQDVTFHHDTDVVVLATGYEPAHLPLAPELADLVVRDGKGRPVIDLDYRVRLTDRDESTLFVQNAELHTHGVGAPDLGLGAHRNAVIINALTGRPIYPVRPRTVFQSFGAPPQVDEPAEPTGRAERRPQEPATRGVT